jgi:hypothetical protein
MGSAVLVGCSKSQGPVDVAPTRTQATAEEATSGSAPAKTSVKLTDQQLMGYVKNVPQNEWKNLDPDVAAQIEAYAKQHPEVKYEGPPTGQ